MRERPFLEPKPCCSTATSATITTSLGDSTTLIAQYPTTSSNHRHTRSTTATQAKEYQNRTSRTPYAISSSEESTSSFVFARRRRSSTSRRPRLRPQTEQLPPGASSPPSYTNNRHSSSSRIFKVALLVHVISLLACASASLSTSSHGSGKGPPQESASSYEYVDDSSSSSREQDNQATTTKKPCIAFHLLRNARNQTLTSNQCLIWSPSMPRQLCSVGETKRFQLLRATYLFPELQPISLYEIFTAGAGPGESLASRLQEGARGIDCVREDEERCVACYERLGRNLRQLDEAYRSFNATLHRFDCLPAVDTSSATRPFSPNGTCNNCRTWYRRWLLVQGVGLWRHQPCINWCYYAQLACPHLAPYKIWDFAGHPSFQCRDFDIYAPEDTDAWCSCIHPCDLKGIVPGNQPIVPTPSGHDFYAARQHCEVRRRQCRSTAHDRHRARQKSKAASCAVVHSLLHLLLVVPFLVFLPLTH